MKGEDMENIIQRAFVSQKSAPNKKLAKIIMRVEKKYDVSSAELDDEILGLVSAAGEVNPAPKTEGWDD